MIQIDFVETRVASQFLVLSVRLVWCSSPCGPTRCILRQSEMASPSIGPDIEAQINSVMEIQPTIMEPDPLPQPTANTATPQLPTSAVPQSQIPNVNQHHNGNSPAQQIADNSQVQRGRLIFPLHQSQISFLYQTRTMETLLMGSGRCTSLRPRSRTRK